MSDKWQCCSKRWICRSQHCSRRTHWQHISGLTSRPKGAEKKETQLGKTLFVSEDAYKNAWNEFRQGQFHNLKECKGKQKGQTVDCVLASDVGVDQAYRCTVVDKNTKLCDTENSLDPDYVEFWYAQKGGKWVLNTAYPSVKGESAPSCPSLKNTKGERSGGGLLQLKDIFELYKLLLKYLG